MHPADGSGICFVRGIFLASLEPAVTGQNSARDVAHFGSGMQTPSAAEVTGVRFPSPLQEAVRSICHFPHTVLFSCFPFPFGRIKKKRGIFLVPVSLLKVENTKIE